MKKIKLIRLMLMAMFLLLGAGGGVMAQKTFGNVPPLHVEGKWFVDENGNKVNLHGVMDTPSPWFNSGRWGWPDLNTQGGNTTVQTQCIDYFKKLFDGFVATDRGSYCNLFRLHLDPCWTNNNSVNASGFTSKDGKTYDPNGTEVSNESDIHHFDKARLKTYMNSVYFKIAKEALNRGMYVIMRPPGVFPHTVKVGDYYNDYLMTVWDIVSQNDSVKKYSGQIMIELGNEPVNLKGADGKDSRSAMHDFFQPIVEKIRANGFTGIILVPGTGYQSNYKEYVDFPITGYNIGYAVHVYSGWYGQSDDNANGDTFIKNFQNQVPVVNTHPIVVTEIDWSPLKEPKEIDHYNEFNQPVYKNYGTWATGTTSKWGEAWKAVHDHFGNIGMTLTHPHDYMNIDKWLVNTSSSSPWTYAVWSKNANRVLEPAFLDAMKKAGHADAYEASSGACFQWYKEWSTVNRPYMAYTRNYTADLGYGKYKNPILNADFPDPDVIRVDDTFYMVSTTFHNFPGATILKSKDLVNWEYCANPLKQIASSDNYNLLNGLNHYAQGMWASSLNYHNGQFYLYFITWGKDGDPGRNIMLTTTNPEGEWKMQMWPDHYYDSGWLFDDGPNGDGNVYVACGIGQIAVNKLDGQTLKKLSDKVVIKDYTINGQKCDGIEGSHMYHIGDYYYIYATTGGYFRGQQIFRSKDPMGPYEECPYMVFENQGIHQGALVDTPTGEWWTILFKDAGSIGRVPYLEPVTWKDGWPVIGKNGIDVTKGGAAYTKPNVGQIVQRTSLPTNDTFTEPQIGMQWGWNHNPDNAAWSLMENPGCLRLHTTGVSAELHQARNTLTQRIWSYVPEGTVNTKVWDSYGTVKMNVSHMQDGDIAGIAVFQDPYALIGVKQVGDKRYVYSRRYYISPNDGTNQEKLGTEEITSDIVYMRAVVNFGTNKAKFYYSLDNQEWTNFGVEMDMRFMLSVFAGQRFCIFNYATKQNGGYVDVDWFSTEPVYDESLYFGEGVLHTYTEEDLTMQSLTIAKTTYNVAPGATTAIDIVCTSLSGMKTSVASVCDYQIADPSVATMVGNCIKGVDAGSTAITATYTDYKGNKKSVTFTVTVPDDLTMKSLEISRATIGITPKSTCVASVICTAKSGVKTDVASKCTYEVEDESVATISNGEVKALACGTTNVTASYTDPRGNTQSVTFAVVVTEFPLYVDGFNPSIIGEGKFTASSVSSALQTSAGGMGGWHYPMGIDLSAYKYLVVKLKLKQTCDASFVIYDANNLTRVPYSIAFGTNTSVVIDLQNMKNSKGTKLYPSHIYYAGFTTNGLKSVYIQEIFLSDDGVNPVAIDGVFADESSEDNIIYNVSGQRLNAPQKGINIIGGKKVFIRK